MEQSFAPAAEPIAGPADRPSPQSGFTLVELMVVVAIIALLAAIIIPNYVHAREQAAVSETEANIQEIATALQLYDNDSQTYPTGTNTNVNPALFGGATNQYLTSTPTNALGRKLYSYTNVPAVGGKPDSYLIKDAGPYDPTTVASLPSGPGIATPCDAACTQIWYDPQDGLYGQP
jgi:general secretion pathway protein G